MAAIGCTHKGRHRFHQSAHFGHQVGVVVGGWSMWESVEFMLVGREEKWVESVSWEEVGGVC